MTPPSIRPAGTGDLSAITRIYAHAVQHGTASFELEPPDEAEMARRWRVLVDGGYPYLVAEQASDRAIVGYAYAGPYRARPAYRWTVEDSIYVEAGVQGRGVGGALLKQLIAEAHARGFRQMIAVIGIRTRPHQSLCIAAPVSAWLERSTTSGSSTDAGSTAC